MPRAPDAYCAWRTQRDTAGWHYRTPTEDEWEKAARGADGRLFVWGNEPCPGCCKSEDCAGHELGDPVMRWCRDESPYGVHDLEGSVLEWCSGSGLSRLRPYRGGHAQIRIAPPAPWAAQFHAASRGQGLGRRVGDWDGIRLVAWREQSTGR